jgi:hypothetical protein
MLSPQIGAGLMGMVFAVYCVLASLLASPDLLRWHAAEPD